MENGDTEHLSWSEAATASGTYGSPNILQKVRAAVLKLLQGSHIYERDGTTFKQRPVRYTLRDKIKKVWNPGDTIIDFGGGLGGTYLNNIDLFERGGFRYIVIEQEQFCEEGARIAQEFSLPLVYHRSLGQVELKGPPKLLIFSGVLQYIEQWPEIVQQGLLLQPMHVIVDRTPLTYDQVRYFSCKYLDYYGSPASYPLQTVLESRLFSELSDYTILAEWSSDFDPEEGNAKGYHFCHPSVSPISEHNQ